MMSRFTVFHVFVACLLCLSTAFRMQPTRMRSLASSSALQALIFQFEYEHQPGSTASTDNLTGLVESLRGNDDAYILYYAQWCPDCISVPSIVQGLETAGAEVVVMCNIGEEREIWRSGEHCFKKAPLNLKGIPTLTRWNNGEQGRMERGLSDGTMIKQGGEELVAEMVARWVEEGSPSDRGMIQG